MLDKVVQKKMRIESVKLFQALRLPATSPRNHTGGSPGLESCRRGSFHPHLNSFFHVLFTCTVKN